METTPLPEDAIHAGKAAKLVGVHPATIHRWVLDGLIPGWRVKARFKRRLYVSRADVLARIEPVQPRNGRERPEGRKAEAARNARTEMILKRRGLI